MLGAACPQCEMRSRTAWTTYSGAPSLEIRRKPTAGEQTRMGRERSDRSKSEGERSPRRPHSNRRLGAASVDEARLENVRSCELDGGQGPPVEVEFGGMREMEPLQREGDFAGAVHYPPWLGVERCLTTPGRVSDGRAHQGADHKARATEGSHVGVRVPPTTEGPPGQALTWPYSECTITVLQSRGRGHNWPAGHLPFKDISEDVA